MCSTFLGEHDFIDDGEQYKQRFGKGLMGNGWYSYNHKGVHFVGLNNCVQVDAMGNMGRRPVEVAEV